jgi:hypothetical protein
MLLGPANAALAPCIDCAPASQHWRSCHRRTSAPLLRAVPVRMPAGCALLLIHVRCAYMQVQRRAARRVRADNRRRVPRVPPPCRGRPLHQAPRRAGRLRSQQLSADVLDAFPGLPLHSDVVEGMRKLSEGGCRLVTFTNGTAAVTEKVFDGARCSCIRCACFGQRLSGTSTRTHRVSM